VLQGSCEGSGSCSFPDLTCDSGRRYGEYSSPELSEQRVSEDEPPTTIPPTTTPPATVAPPICTNALLEDAFSTTNRGNAGCIMSQPDGTATMAQPQVVVNATCHYKNTTPFAMRN
jgi:hypothetical protein